eukprot:1430797-Rhodomonas_salina.1
MLGMWSRLWHVNQRTQKVGDYALVSNRLCVPRVNEILAQNLHVLDPLLQVIKLPSSDVLCVDLHCSHARTAWFEGVLCKCLLCENRFHSDRAGVRQLRLNGAESFLDCTKVTKEFGVRSWISVVGQDGKHKLVTAGDDQFHYLLLKGRARNEVRGRMVHE